MAIKVRAATEKDIGFILDGYFKVNQDSPMGRDVSLSADRIRAEILGDNPKAHIDVAEVDGERAGFIFYSTVYFASTGRVIWITIIYIDPFARGAGVPRHLVMKARETIPDAKGLYGATEKGNLRALGYFQAIGAKKFDKFEILGSNDHDHA